MSLMIPAEINNTGPWQKIYWSQGAAAAQDYCAQVVGKFKKMLSVIGSIQKKFKDYLLLGNLLKKIVFFYDLKMGHYLADQASSNHSFTFNKAEPGRSPFNCPDFRRRFSKQEELFEFFGHKIEFHQKCSSWLQKVLKELPKEIPERQALIEMRQIHMQSINKWNERKIMVQENPQPFLLPEAKDPLEVLNIHWAHNAGYFGKGAEALVIEHGADLSHPALSHTSLMNKEALDELGRGEHGTHVCGIIAAQENTNVSHEGKKVRHVGAAPESKLQLILHDFDEIEKSPIDIVNFSGVFFNRMAKALSDSRECFIEFLEEEIANEKDDSSVFPLDMLLNAQQLAAGPDWGKAKQKLLQFCEELQDDIYDKTEPLFDNKLVIMSMGNQGVVIDQNDEQMFHRSYSLLDPDRREQSIQVVNLLPNGVYPDPESNLPGEQFAEMTICAIGSDVLSTLPENKYGTKSGTSMAAPFVTGVALQLEGAFSELTPEEIRYCILDSATPIVLDENHVPHLITNPEDLKKYTFEQIKFSQRFFGVGLLNAKGAIKKAKEQMAAKTQEV